MSPRLAAKSEPRPEDRLQARVQAGGETRGCREEGCIRAGYREDVRQEAETTAEKKSDKPAADTKAPAKHTAKSEKPAAKSNKPVRSIHDPQT